MRQMVFQTQDILNKVSKLTLKEPQPKEKPTKDIPRQNKPFAQDAKRSSACYDCKEKMDSKTHTENHFHCLDCGKFFMSARDINQHIQDKFLKEIQTECDHHKCYALRGTWRIWSNISTIGVHFSTTKNNIDSFIQHW